MPAEAESEMDLERLSGLLLGIVALAAVAYFAKELIAIRVRRRIRIGDLAEAGKRALRAVAAHGDAKPANDRLMAGHGKVVAHSANAARPMRVRVAGELWSARSRPPAQAQLPVGTPIEVKGIEGSILIVEARILSSTDGGQVESL